MAEGAEVIDLNAERVRRERRQREEWTVLREPTCPLEERLNQAAREALARMCADKDPGGAA